VWLGSGLPQHCPSYMKFMLNMAEISGRIDNSEWIYIQVIKHLTAHFPRGILGALIAIMFTGEIHVFERESNQAGLPHAGVQLDCSKERKVSMGSHHKAFNSLNEAVKVLASSGDELHYRLMVVCRDYLVHLEVKELGEGLYSKFEILRNELSLDDEQYQDMLLNLDDTKAVNLARAICDFQILVCEEYFKPGSFF
jgi:hypothetical protein